MKQIVLNMAMIIMAQKGVTSTLEVKNSLFDVFLGEGNPAKPHPVLDPTFSLSQHEVSSIMNDLYVENNWDRVMNQVPVPHYVYTDPAAVKPALQGATHIGSVNTVVSQPTGIDPAFYFKILHIISSHCDIPVSDIRHSNSFVNDLGFDSLDIIECVMHLERDFNICIKDADVELMFIVQDVVNYMYTAVGLAPTQKPVFTTPSTIATNKLDPKAGAIVAYVKGKPEKYIQVNTHAEARKACFTKYNDTEIGLTYDDIRRCSVEYFNRHYTV